MGEGIKKSPHPEEGAKRPSRRTHGSRSSVLAHTSPPTLMTSLSGGSRIWLHAPRRQRRRLSPRALFLLGPEARRTRAAGPPGHRPRGDSPAAAALPLHGGA